VRGARWRGNQSITISLPASFSSTFTITNTGDSTYGLSSEARKSFKVYLGSSPVDLAVYARNPNGAGKYWSSLLNGPLDIGDLAPSASVSGIETGSASPKNAVYTDNATLCYFEGTAQLCSICTPSVVSICTLLTDLHTTRRQPHQRQ
jgi:hypothetical protein